MPMPKSIVKNKRKSGVHFISTIDRTKYTLYELTRGALRDIGKVLTYRIRNKIRKIASSSLSRSRRVNNAYQYWNRKKSLDLILMIKHETWYGTDQELGTDGQPKRDILRSTVLENVDVIREIQAKYLKHIEDEIMAERMIDENAEVADDDQNA